MRTTQKTIIAKVANHIGIDISDAQEDEYDQIQDVAEGVMAEDHTRLVAECYEIGLQKVIVARWTRERVQESN